MGCVQEIFVKLLIHKEGVILIKSSAHTVFVVAILVAHNDYLLISAHRYL